MKILTTIRSDFGGDLTIRRCDPSITKKGVWIATNSEDEVLIDDPELFIAELRKVVEEV